MKKIIVFLTIALFAFPLFANGSKESQSSPKKPELRLAFTWENGFEETMEAYAEDVSDRFILTLEHTPGLDHKQKIQIDVSGGNIPDVFTYWSYETNLGDMARSNLIVDVEEIIAASDKISWEDFSEGAWSATEIDGKHYSFPYESFKGYMAVNSEIFKKYNLAYPKTWEDMRNISQVLRQHDIIPLSMGSLRGDAGHLFFSALTYQAANGYQDTVNMKKSKSFIYEGTKVATEAVLDLIKWKAIPEDTISSGGWDAQLALYNSEKAAMIYTFPWMLSSFETDIAEKTEIIPVPKIPRCAVDPAGFTVGGIAQGLLVSREAWDDPAKRPAILELVEYLLSDEMFILRAKQEGSFPAKIVDISGIGNPLFEKVLEATASQDIYGIHEFFFTNLEAFDNYKSANDQLWAGVLTEDEFLNLVQSGL